MTIVGSLRSATHWLRRKTRALALRLLRRLTAVRGELRQFVYLDEVALRSLMASRYGAEEVKVIESRVRGSESGSSVGTQLGEAKSGSLNAGLTSRNTATRSLQVERQPSIQSMFGEFLRREREHGSLIWDVTAGNALPQRVRRGQLLQVQVRLAADPIYRIGAFITEFSDMAKNLPENQRPDMTQLAPLSGVLERLMVGQIPIRARIDRVAARWDGAEIKIRSEKGTSELPLFLVASTDSDKYWTDTRRVLYGDQLFTALVRVTIDGPTETWSAIKLFDMMRHIVPDLSEKLDQLDSAIGSVPPRPTTDTDAVLPLTVALETYAQAIGVTTDDSRFSAALTSLVQDLARRLPSATELNNAFDAVDAWAEQNGLELPKNDARIRARTTSREVASLDVRGAVHAEKIEVSAAMPSPTSFIESEVIAIYW